MFTLAWHAAVFLLFTLVVYLVCIWIAGKEEERERRRR
jgi:hypothetical protein